MSDTDILRPVDRGLSGKLQAFFFANQAAIFRFLRAAWPIPKAGGVAAVTRYDDVIEVFLNDAAFSVPYADNLNLIMDGAHFFLGVGDTPEYRQDVAAMRAVVLASDLPQLTAAALSQADAILDASGGRVEVVDFTRQVTFGVLCPYFGITPPSNGDLRVWATRLFEFQFTYSGKSDPGVKDPLYLEAARMAPLLRAHVDKLIAAARGGNGTDDVLHRCLARQAAGEEAYTDTKIRSALIGFLVGGLPQPPMVLPFALEQLLQRDKPFAQATQAAFAQDTDAVGRYMFEALRFDPLAPLLQRKTVKDAVVAAGTHRVARIPAGSTVGVSFASAMRDPRRVANPETFNPNRPSCEYMHFGYGLHRCFGEYINRAVLPAMMQRLLARRVRRAPGAEGRLVKRRILANTLWVEF